MCVCVHQRQLYAFVSPSIVGFNTQAVFRVTGLQRVPRHPVDSKIEFQYDKFRYSGAGHYLFEVGMPAYFLFDQHGRCLGIWTVGRTGK